MKRIIALLCIVLLLFAACSAGAKGSASFESGELKLNDRGDCIRYWLFTPKNAREGMPLIVYLHGGSAKGDDIRKLIENGFCKGVYDGDFDDSNAYILFPQLDSKYRGWENAARAVKQPIDFTVRKYEINSENISLTGHSMGGTGAFVLAIAYPKMFARIAPMSGSVECTQENVEALANMPVWAFVGAEDTIVSPELSEKFVESLNQAGGNARLTVFEGATHFDVPALAYFDSKLNVLYWLIGNGQ